MSDKIEPALSPEEWANEDGRGGVDRGDFMVYAPLGMDGLVVGPPGPLNGVLLPTDLFHATAAIVLHGQPFGFTWEDVEALREGASEIDSEWTTPQPIADTLRALADRIAAILPPRT